MASTSFLEALPGFEEAFAKISERVDRLIFTREITKAVACLVGNYFNRLRLKKEIAGIAAAECWDQLIYRVANALRYHFFGHTAAKATKEFFLEGPDISQSEDLKLHAAYHLCAEVLGWTGKKN